MTKVEDNLLLRDFSPTARQALLLRSATTRSFLPGATNHLPRG